jgi:hypothetical protein
MYLKSTVRGMDVLEPNGYRAMKVNFPKTYSYAGLPIHEEISLWSYRALQVTCLHYITLLVVGSRSNETHALGYGCPSVFSPLPLSQ